MTAAQKYRYEFVDYEEFMHVFQEHRQKLFTETDTVELTEVHSIAENNKRHELSQQVKKGIKLCALAYDGDRLIGWSLGEQENGDIFYMRSSAVYPEYRRRGVYQALLNMIVDQAVNLGFQQIRSRHLASNNAVIIPKLKSGFMIRGMEICERYGVLVLLSYYPHEKRQELFRYRTGETKYKPANTEN